MKDKRDLIILIIVAILTITVSVESVILFTDKKENNNNQENSEKLPENDNQSNENKEDNIENSIALYDGLKGSKIYFYADYSVNGNITYTSSSEILEDSEFARYEVLGDYVCNYDGCKVFTVVNKKYAIIYDKEYFIYDFENKIIKKQLNVEIIEYVSLEGISNKSGEVVGVVIEKKDENYSENYRLMAAYFDVETQKNVIDFGVYNRIYSDSTVIEKGFVIAESEVNSQEEYYYNSVLYNIKENKIEKDNINGYISGNNSVYYYSGEVTVDVDISKIYDEYFNLIYESKNDKFIGFNDYYMTDQDKLIISYDNKFYIYDKNYKLEYTSKEYEIVYNVFKDYLAVKEDGYLKIVDYKGVEKANLCKLTSENYVHSMISGWYTENGKNGIYMVVSDKNAFSEISDDVKQEWGITDDSADMLGYEYFYIPNTGETGKIATPIGGYAKPVLYLYPTKDNTLVNITFAKPELLTTTYPKYINNWSIIANKNGDIYDNKGRYYYGLYWEEQGNTKIDFSEGFYVEKENAIEFLESKLDEIGLNQREANEFIMYWLPILEKNEKSLVYFELTEERQKYNYLNINPKPSSMLRIAIHIKKVDNKVNIKNQEFKNFERNGFTVVEWGGAVH